MHHYYDAHKAYEETETPKTEVTCSGSHSHPKPQFLTIPLPAGGEAQEGSPNQGAGVYSTPPV